MDSNFKDLAVGVQSLVLFVTVIAGGLWSYYTFRTLRQVDIAKAQLENLRRVSLDLSIDTAQVGGLAEGRRGLIIRVKVRNNGSRYVNLDLTNKPLAVSRVVVEKTGELHAAETLKPDSYIDIRSDANDKDLFLGVLPGSIKELSYYVPITQPGVYMIRFLSPVPPGLEREFEDAEKLGADLARKTAEKRGLRYTGANWKAATFIEVR